VGFPYSDDFEPAVVGAHATIRKGTIVYGDVVIGDHLQTGHNALVREHTQIGDRVVVGTATVIDGRVEIGDCVKIESQCYIPTHVEIGNQVFFGPGVTLTNDHYPLKMRDEYEPDGPTIKDGVTLGADCTVNPGLTIGADSFVASAAVVTDDVPPKSLVKGVPGQVEPLPDHLRERNMAPSWREHLDG